ncbi:hypothetical protein Tco_0541014 [Tanacetum coccineum]
MSLAYYNSIRKNGYEYRGRNFVGLGRDMHIFVGNMSYVMDFTILENIETNIDPSLSHVVFGLPFVEIACLAINRKHGLMTFTDGTKEITFKTQYEDPERSELCSEGHELLSSRIILSEDDYDRGCRKPSNLEDILKETKPLSFGHRIGRKVHLLEDKQIPSVRVFDEVFLALGWHLEEIHVTWAHLKKKQTRLRTYTKSLEDLCKQCVETASQASSDAVMFSSEDDKDLAREMEL